MHALELIDRFCLDVEPRVHDLLDVDRLLWRDQAALVNERDVFEALAGLGAVLVRIERLVFRYQPLVDAPVNQILVFQPFDVKLRVAEGRALLAAQRILAGVGVRRRAGVLAVVHRHHDLIAVLLFGGDEHLAITLDMSLDLRQIK